MCLSALPHFVAEKNRCKTLQDAWKDLLSPHRAREVKFKQNPTAASRTRAPCLLFRGWVKNTSFLIDI